jgi:hypothetical protein
MHHHGNTYSAHCPLSKKEQTRRYYSRYMIHDVSQGGPRTEQVLARVQERYTDLSSR